MRIVLILALLAVLATAAPPLKKTGKTSPSGTAGGKKQEIKSLEKPLTKGNRNETDDDEQEQQDQDYCYDSTWSFKCRHTSPNQYELECKIANVDGDPCFPNLVQMIEAAAPLNTISYPVHSFEAYENADNIEQATSIVTADNIESISLQAPFEYIPADAFASLPQLKRITLESLDGVKNVNIHQHAFRNTTAKHLHLSGHNLRHVLNQHVNLQNFNTVTFSDVEIDCYQQAPHQQVSWSNENQSCQHIFDNLQGVETLSLEAIYVKGDQLDQHVFQPLQQTLKKLSVDVVYKTPSQQGDDDDEDDDDQNQQQGNNNSGTSQSNQNNQPNSTNSTIQHRGYFPVESFAFLSKLEDLELYLYEPIVGLTIEKSTQVPLPVSKTLTRLVLSCRYCQNINLQQLGQWLPNLQHVTIAAPLNQATITEESLKQWSKLEEFVIYDGDVQSFNQQAFRNSQALKHLSIKYAAIKELNQDQWTHVENTLQSLAVVGTQIQRINVSSLKHLTQLDISDNELTTIEHNMFPEKAQFSELNISYNPVKQVQNGFLSGIELTNHALHVNGWEIESFDVNAVEGIENLRVVDVTRNLNLKKIQVSNYQKLPDEIQRLVVGRSPNLQLEDQNGQIAQWLREDNVTLVIEGQVACSCKMNWINEVQQENPQWIEINRSRAVCSRQGTNVDNIPETFWKNPTVANFLHQVKEGQICNKQQ